MKTVPEQHTLHVKSWNYFTLWYKDLTQRFLTFVVPWVSQHRANHAVSFVLSLGSLCQVQQHQFAPSVLPVTSTAFPFRSKGAQQAVAVSSVSPPAPFQNVPPAVSQTPVIAATPVPTITANVPPVAAPAAAAPPPPAAPIMPVVPPTPPVVKVNPGSSSARGRAALPDLTEFLLSPLGVELGRVESHSATFRTVQPR